MFNTQYWEEGMMVRNDSTHIAEGPEGRGQASRCLELQQQSVSIFENTRQFLRLQPLPPLNALCKVSVEHL